MFLAFILMIIGLLRINDKVISIIFLFIATALFFILGLYLLSYGIVQEQGSYIV